MTQSSGLFTFPATGIWRVDLKVYCYIHDAATRWFDASINYTSNNGSSYVSAGYGVANLYDSGNSTSATAYNTAFLDITDTSNHKVRFSSESVTAAIVYGHTSQTSTGATFIRLGDT